MNKKNFSLIGASGYIAPKHVNAIKETGNNLVVAMDKHDIVGYLDSYFFDCEFFSEFELFEKYIVEQAESRSEKKIDYVSICTPDYLHDAHIRFALRNDANAICEKPLVMNTKDLDSLLNFESQIGKKVNTILQLRVHPSLLKLRDMVQNENKSDKYIIDLTYVTLRGKWFFETWKGNPKKSGGVVCTIGIHFFDMLIWIFGKPVRNELHFGELKKYGGYLELEKAKVRWFLSVDDKDIPGGLREGNQAYRSITVDGNEIEFSTGFKDLHTVVYEDILSGNGFGIKDARPALELVEQVKGLSIKISDKDTIHPMVNKLLK